MIGDPVVHSLSPLLHNTAFSALGVKALYLACQVKPGQAGAALEGIRAMGIAGANVTSPHKELVLPYLDRVSPAAERIASVNTIVNRQGFLEGYSTDGEGFWRALQAIVPGSFNKDRPVMIIGAGGAGRAIVYSLAEKGCRNFIFVNRTIERAEELAGLLTADFASVKAAVKELTVEAILPEIDRAGLFVYTLPEDSSHFIDSLTGKKQGLVTSRQILCDIRYSPPVSKTMSAFEAAGGRAYNGLGMLIYQAAEAFELFTGLKAPLDLMKRAAQIQ